MHRSLAADQAAGMAAATDSAAVAVAAAVLTFDRAAQRWLIESSSAVAVAATAATGVLRGTQRVVTAEELQPRAARPDMAVRVVVAAVVHRLVAAEVHRVGLVRVRALRDRAGLEVMAVKGRRLEVTIGQAVAVVVGGTAAVVVVVAHSWSPLVVVVVAALTQAPE